MSLVEVKPRLGDSTGAQESVWGGVKDPSWAYHNHQPSDRNGKQDQCA